MVYRSGLLETPAVEFVESYDATQELIREQANHLNVPGYGRN